MRAPDAPIGCHKEKAPAFTLMADLKKVHAGVDEQTALYQLDTFDQKGGGKYPKIALSWRDNWANLSTYFKYPQEVRTLIHTTNAIEKFSRQLRKVPKSKLVSRLTTAF